MITEPPPAMCLQVGNHNRAVEITGVFQGFRYIDG